MLLVSKDEILAELYRLHVVLCNFTTHTHLPKPSLLQVLVDEKTRFYNFINFLLFLEPSTHNAMRVDIYI